jgi:hypothetical protein
MEKGLSARRESGELVIEMRIRSSIFISLPEIHVRYLVGDNAIVWVMNKKNLRIILYIDKVFKAKGLKGVS